MSVAGLQDATVAIMGCGLIGGSIGLALQGVVRHRIALVADGIDGVEAAVEAGAFDEAVVLPAGLASADIVILAMPVLRIEEWIARVVHHMKDGAVLMDVGSVKGAIIAEMESIPEDSVAAVGTHPMCGGERGGAGNARADLFAGAPWVVVPCSRSTDRSLELVQQLIEAMGAHPAMMDARVHDAAVAVSSHLPFIAAVGLLNVLDAAGDPAGKLVAGGFRDMTRIASGSGAMWSDILRSNEGEIRVAMRSLEDAFHSIREALNACEQSGDSAPLDEILKRARSRRASLWP